ncbi:MAG: nucleoside phosphorylase [Proteobacteria bacterium]|nr:nucleoside phosphorylase [Pseudomonadota bacterium]
MGSLAVMAATLPDLNYLVKHLGFDQEDSRSFYSSQVYTRLENGRGFSLTGPFIGAPHAVMLLENLVCLGISQVIFMGWCGSVSPDACIGDILVPSCAFSDEGTSRHYGLDDPGICVEPSLPLQALMAETCRAQGLSFKQGPVWTTDAIYRETPEKIDDYRKRGALAVDMELSALCTAAAFRGIQLASVLVVSDEVWTHTWKPGFGNKEFKQSRKAVTQMIATLVERIFNG